MPYDQRNDRGGNYDNRNAPPRNYQNEFPNSGSMHSREKRTPNAPDMGGDFTITGEVLDYVLREAQNSREVKLELSAWRKMSRANVAFLSLSINTPYAYRQQQQNPGYRNQGYGRPGQSVPADERRAPPPQQNDMFPGDQPSRGGYADQSGGRYRVDQVPRGRSDIPDFMRDDDRGADRRDRRRELDDEIPF